MRRTYTFYSDPGHGWLAVPISDLKEFGVEKQITQFSYRSGNTAYLEEDVDAGRFIDALTEKGVDLGVTYSEQDGGFIRNFRPFY